MKQVNQVKRGAKFIADTQHRVSHDRCLWDARMRRDRAAKEIPEWEEMRETASLIKLHTLSNLAYYLKIFEENAVKNGIKIHWAVDAEEHNRIVAELLKAHDVKVITKSKSMLTEECGLRSYLSECGFEVYEADLGERIQQLDNQPPSHIVMPAIHKLRSDVARLFAEKLGSDPSNDDPYYLNSVMRKDMRKKYIHVDAGLTGVNFAVAETGGIVVCTNEGNADISANVPPLLIASMGIEKVIPTVEDLGLFIRLLSRSALGFDITQFTSHYHGPRKGQEMHIVIVDNGRSKRLSADYFQVLKCIRCGACMNTCPIFRRTGGLSYDATYMGPIGSVLQPGYDLHRYARLPYSCTHCGSCGNVCPVKIPIPDLIFYWRNVIVKEKEDELIHNIEMTGADIILRNSTNFMLAEKIGLLGLRNIPSALLDSKLNPWYAAHANPIPPEKTFRQYYKNTLQSKEANELSK